MTEKQFFGAIVRGIGLWLLCQCFITLLTVGAMTLTTPSNGGNIEWVVRELLLAALGVFLITRAAWVVERCYATKE